MKTLTRVVIPSLLSISLIAGASNLEQEVEYNSPKPVPDVTLDLVQEVFGMNLDNASGMKKILLLAIGMDHTTLGSPNVNQNVGIPFIVDRGPNYWVSKLINKEYDIDVLVNNALLLLFSKENIHGAEKAAMQLLSKAADMGYWPADYYMADYNITNKLAKDFDDISTVTTSIVDPELKKIAADTMAKFNNCAQMGFAPCQYRVGFWLTSSENGLKDGIEVLKSAIKTTLADKRYQGILNGSLIKAAKEIVMKGDFVGMDDDMRKDYFYLMNDQIKLIEQSRGMPSDIYAASKDTLQPVLDYIGKNTN